jgi:hypothetical protein
MLPPGSNRAGGDEQDLHAPFAQAGHLTSKIDHKWAIQTITAAGQHTGADFYHQADWKLR